MYLTNKANNNKNGQNKTVFYKAVLMPAFVLFSLASSSQDLLKGSDLQDSPLSLSLTTTIPMTINNQSQQIVISQYGISNQATVNQMANNANTALVNQVGINNIVNIEQQGYDNFVSANQQGNNNYIDVKQVGDGNVANIWREGEQSFTVHQIGNEMVVNITQY